jgi:hypothetical protein
MQIKQIQNALTTLVLDALPKGVKVLRQDVPEPLPRPCVKIDILPFEVSPACAGMREYDIDVDIWYYPQDKNRPRDECRQTAEMLTDALVDGFDVGGEAWLQITDDISCDLSNGVLVLQFQIAWTASAGETGELMETLILDKKEVTDYGSNNA